MFIAPAVCAAGTNDEWLAQPWQAEEGLPENVVTGVAQPMDGYLWVGTPSGLTRFDGLRFEPVSLTNVIASPNRGAVVRLSGNSSRAFVKYLPNSLLSGLVFSDSDFSIVKTG